MRYPYHDLYAREFEKLALGICEKILGIGVQDFSEGPDGGRDARFEGTAQTFPSTTAPYTGRFIIQAKHTLAPFAKFSDKSFSSEAESSTLSEEIPKVKRLVTSGELDHYLLFSNRRLGAQADAAIRARIEGQTGVKSVSLFGVERLDQMLKAHPDVEDNLKLNALNAPLIITSDDLAEVICALARQKESITQSKSEFAEIERTRFEHKNEANNLSKEYEKHILRTYLHNFEAVKDFLANPINDDVRERYEEAAVEIQEQLLAHRTDFLEFEKVFTHLQLILFTRDGDLAENKRLTKLVLYYMYWNCDIGEDD